MLLAGFRRLGMRLGTLLGLKRHGFFIPYRYAGAVQPAPYPALEPLFVRAEARMGEVLEAIARYADRLHGFAGPPPRPRWDQDWFARLDGAAAYALVRERRPRRILEIGSGHSTRFLAQAARDAGTDTEIICIDPQPRAPLAGLGVRHIAALLDTGDPEFARLDPGDVLFIDSSHIAMPGSDVDRLLGDLLPRLPVGVFVHLHDILLPDAYPAAWEWRGYNEQFAVACLLQGGAYAIEFASHWLISRRADCLERAGLSGIPLVTGAVETSLWLRKAA